MMVTVHTTRPITPLLRSAVGRLRFSLRPFQAFGGRLRYLLPRPRRFSGCYPDYQTALAAARAAGAMPGYDHAEVAPVSFDRMCRVAPWDYPVLFWLQRLSPEVRTLVDAGGHMGTKYLAFRAQLAATWPERWIVYDVPAIVEAGRQRAAAEGLMGLEFVSDLSKAGRADLLLGSGLLQYLDVPVSQLLLRMTALPPHLILNKVAFRKGTPHVTLERIGPALVPYQMRNEEAFLREVTALGYELIDRWSIPSLSHVIDTHPEKGASESAGFYFRLREERGRKDAPD